MHGDGDDDGDGPMMIWLSHKAWEVELRELVNPSLVVISDQPTSGRDETCAPDQCRGHLTRVSSKILPSIMLFILD